MRARSATFDKPLFAERTVIETPSLRRNVSWTLVGNGTYAGCQLLMVVALAKLGSAGMVGQFTLAFALCAPVFMLFNLQLRGVQATDARCEFAFREYFVLRLVASLLALLVLASIAGASSYEAETTRVILLVGFAKAIESVSDVLYGPLQQREHMDRIAKSMIIRGLLSLVGLVVGLTLTGRLTWGVVGLSAAWAATLVGYDLPRTMELLRRPFSGMVAAVAGTRWDARRVAKLAWMSLPLGIVMTLISLNASLPRYFIERHLGAHDLGVFMAMAYVMVVGTTIMTAFFQSSTPRLARYHVQGDRRAFGMLLQKLMLVGAAVGVAGILVALLFGRQVLTVLYRPEFAVRTDVFVWLMVVAALQYLGSVLSVAMTSMRMFAAQAPIQVVSALITIAALLVLVPQWGLLGAAWALFAEALWSRAAFAVLLRSRLRARWGQV